MLVPAAAAVPMVSAGDGGQTATAVPVATASGQAVEPQKGWGGKRPAREIFHPAAGVRPRGAVLLIHGGGWQGGDPRHMKSIAPDGRRLASWGYVVWSVDYSSGLGSLPDLIRWQRLLRNRYPGLPICAKGTSAGGNLALLLAARTPLRCVVSEAGPTDLFRFGFRTVDQYFPEPGEKRAYSPLSYVDRGAYRRDRILLAHLRDDPIVPFTQSRRFARRAGLRLVGLPSGTQPFVHSGANLLALSRYREIERRHIARSMRAQRARDRR